MTYETHVFISEKDLPTAQKWAEAVTQSAYALSMPQQFAMPGDEAHFIPCDINNLASGFDLKIEEANLEDYNLNAQQRAQIGKRNLVASFQTYSNSQEIAGMVVASALLAETFDGVMISELEEQIVLPGHNIAYIDQHLKNCRDQFDGACDARGAYDPQDPTANTIAQGSAWLGFALLAIIGVLVLVVSVLGKVKSWFAKPKKNHGHNAQAKEVDTDDEDFASRG